MTLPYQIYYKGNCVHETFGKIQDIWSGDFSVASKNGSIMKYIIQCLKSLDVFFIIIFTDGNIKSDLIRDILKETKHDYNKIKNKIVVGTLAQKVEDENLNYLYMPLDDKIFDDGIFFDNLIPWKDRKSIAYWRGGASGWGLQTVRCRVVEKLMNYTNANVKLIKCGWEQGKNIPDSFFGEKVHFRKFMDYKIFLIIDGNCIASNHMWGFATGCIPFIISNATCWFQKFLIPDVNYIHIHFDLSNLIEKIEWVIHNDSQAEKIAENALQFSKTHFTPSFQRENIKEQVKNTILKNI
jgi:hypothetical protein